MRIGFRDGEGRSYHRRVRAPHKRWVALRVLYYMFWAKLLWIK